MSWKPDHYCSTYHVMDQGHMLNWSGARWNVKCDTMIYIIEQWISTANCCVVLCVCVCLRTIGLMEPYLSPSLKKIGWKYPPKMGMCSIQRAFVITANKHSCQCYQISCTWLSWCGKLFSFVRQLPDYKNRNIKGICSLLLTLWQLLITAPTVSPKHPHHWPPINTTTSRKHSNESFCCYLLCLWGGEPEWVQQHRVSLVFACLSSLSPKN